MLNAHTALPFVFDAHRVIITYANTLGDRAIDSVSKKFVVLDGFYEAMTLNYVTRRASKAQGIGKVMRLKRVLTTSYDQRRARK